jgi:hypothetical protein
MRNFSDEQGRTRVFVEAYRWYSADGNPRRTPLIVKRAIYGWKLTKHKLLSPDFVLSDSKDLRPKFALYKPQYL